MFPDKKAYKSDHIILDKDLKKNDLKDFSFTFLELPKFNKKNIEELDNMVDKWAYFFKYSHNYTNEKFSKELNNFLTKNEVIKDAYEELKSFNWTDEELIEYNGARKIIMDHNSSLLFAKKSGIKEGIVKGQIAEKVAIAKSMLAQKLPIKLISTVTGLPKEKVLKLNESE